MDRRLSLRTEDEEEYMSGTTITAGVHYFSNGLTSEHHLYINDKRSNSS